MPDRGHRDALTGLDVRIHHLGEVHAVDMVSADDEILVFSSAGNIIRMEAGEISSQGRDATGVRIARVGAGEQVSAVAPVLESAILESEVGEEGST